MLLHNSEVPQWILKHLVSEAEFKLQKISAWALSAVLVLTPQKCKIARSALQREMSRSVQKPKSNLSPGVKTFKAASLRYIQVLEIQTGMDWSFHFLLEGQDLELSFLFKVQHEARKKKFPDSSKGQLLEGCLLSLFQKLLKARKIIINDNHIQDFSEMSQILWKFYFFFSTDIFISDN